MQRIHQIFLVVALAAIVVSCKTRVAYTKPDLQLPSEFRFTATADTASIANMSWKQFFSDQTLQQLIEKGLTIISIQIALKQVAASQERLLQAKYLQFPDINFTTSAQISRPSKTA